MALAFGIASGAGALQAMGAVIIGLVASLSVDSTLISEPTG